MPASFNLTENLTAHLSHKLCAVLPKAVICTLCSNVTGQILLWKEIGQLCQERDICFVADGAQACGVLDVKLSDGISILCTAGYKGLYGITGTGLLVTDGKFPLPPLMQGGSGSQSNLPEMPSFLPDMLESGTLNIIGAASLRAGLHCAPLVHRAMGNPDGAVRFSPSVFSRMPDTERLADTVRMLTEERHLLEKI